MALLLLSAVLVTAVDQGSKLLVTRRLQEHTRVAAGGLRFRRLMNPKAGSRIVGRGGVLVIWCLEAMLLLALAGWEPWSGWTTQVALGLVLGGVTGNCLDRVRLGGIVDFIALWSLPVFNVADAAIVSGVMLGAFLAW